jgi:hypothetical protein
MKGQNAQPSPDELTPKTKLILDTKCHCSCGNCPHRYCMHLRAGTWTWFYSFASNTFLLVQGLWLVRTLPRSVPHTQRKQRDWSGIHRCTQTMSRQGSHLELDLGLGLELQWWWQLLGNPAYTLQCKHRMRHLLPQSTLPYKHS